MLDITESEYVPDIKTACALGLFDGVHMGHRLVINEAVKLSEKGFKTAVFSFATDTVTSKGGLEAILTEEQKRRHFSELGVDYLFSPDFAEFRNMSAECFVRDVLKGKLNCAAAVCGSDFRFGKGAEGNAQTLKKLGEKYDIEVIVLDKLFIDGDEVSSTAVREYIREGEIEKANRLLGYSFGFMLPVVHGNELGRTWNFPTINQIIPQGQVLPKFGVYCARAEIGGKLFYGVTNVGMKPTVNVATLPLAETYIIDFDGDLYGKRIEIMLDRFVRPERKFGSFDELKEQISKDTEFTRNYYGI